MQAQTEVQAIYAVERAISAAMDDDAIIRTALGILEVRMRREALTMGSPAVVKQYLQMRAAEHDAAGREAFGCLWLDAQNRVIECETLFTGTLTQTSVYPREVVKRALAHNAASVILFHNHPSGFAEASRADEVLTQALKSALQLIDVRILDHIITAGSHAVSMAESGLI